MGIYCLVLTVYGQKVAGRKKVEVIFIPEPGSAGKHTFRQPKFFPILNFAKILSILHNISYHCFDRKEGRGWGRGKKERREEDKAHENRHM